jgi:hypothetical protein
VTPVFAKLRGKTCAVTAAALLDRSSDRVVLLGPLIWYPSDGASSRVWRFFVNVGNSDGGMRLGKFGEDEEGMAGALREGMKEAFAALRPRVEAIDFDDELQMAYEAVKRWPCERSRALFDGVMRERARLAALYDRAGDATQNSK